MKKHVCKVLMMGIGLLVLSCSRSATPGGPKTPGNSSGIACTANGSCADPAETCDLLWPLTQGGTGGTCRQKCNPNGPACSNIQETCNPITGACELDCGQESNPEFCKNNLPNIPSLSAVCVSGHYCGFVDTNPGNNNCGSQLSLKGAGGFCKVPCQSSSECPGSSSEYGSWQTCDPITGTCEVGCSVGGASCASPTYQLTNSTPPVLACSPITGTCVQSCVVSSAAAQPPACTSVDATRKTCYSLGYQTGPGTCERTCVGTCPVSQFKCVESICQPGCQTSKDCANNTCDLIDHVCRMGCTYGGAPCANGGVCSSMSGTCVGGPCTPGSCLPGAKRSQCLVPPSGSTVTTSTCEVPCGKNGSACTDPTLFCTITPVTGLSTYCAIACKESDASTCGPGVSSCVEQCPASQVCNSDACKVVSP